MGVSIDIHVYEVSSLLDDMEKFVAENGGYREGALPVRQWFTRVAPKFGLIEGSKFITLWNEYYEDYSAASEFLGAVDKYYFPERDKEDWYDSFWSDKYRTVSGANAEEVLSELFPEEFGYEGKFAE